MQRQNHSEQEMKKLDNKKSLLIAGVVDISLLAYLIVLLLGFLKLFNEAKILSNCIKVNYIATNEIINSESSLTSENTFYYLSHNHEIDNDEVLYFHSDKNQDVSIGTYNPASYIYGTEDRTLYISFKLDNISLYKVTYTEVFVSDIDGKNVSLLTNRDYSTFKKDGYYTLKYSKDAPKYIYALSLTYYVKK